MSVARVRLGEVLSLERREVRIDPTASYTLVGVYSFGKGLFHQGPKSGSELGDYRFYRVAPGDLVLSNIGAWEGGIGFAAERDAGLVGNHRVLTYAARDKRIDTNWARWFLLSEQGMALIRRAAPGTVMRNRTLAIERFEALEVPLLPIAEQRGIAERINRIEARAAELLRRSRHSATLIDAVTGSIALRPDLQDATKTTSGWRRLPLGEVLTPATDQVPVEPGQQYLIAGIYSFGRGLIDRGTIDGAETSYKTLTRLSEGDVVVSKLNGWEGAVAVADQTFEGYHVSSEYPVFKLDQSQLLPSFFAGIARAPSFWDDLNTNARGSMVRRRRINPAQFLATEVWLPPIDVQDQAARASAMATDAGRRRLETRVRIEALVPAALNESFRSLS